MLGAFLYIVCAVGVRNGAVGMVHLYSDSVQKRDRVLIDGYWVVHTSAWEIPGTEDLKPYITAADKKRKWIIGTWVWQLYPQFLRE